MQCKGFLSQRPYDPRSVAQARCEMVLRHKSFQMKVKIPSKLFTIL